MKIDITINPEGCPCSRDCCNEPEVVYPHKHDEECDEDCMDNYITKCENCNQECNHES